MERIAKAKSKARKFFQDKRTNCLESVFKVIHEVVGSDLPVQVSPLFPLGGGVGIRGENCGAMLAGVMALGLVYGRFDPSRVPSKNTGSTFGIPTAFATSYSSDLCKNTEVS